MKEKSKKILFIIALIPYIIFLILGLINCITYLVQFNHLDLYELIEPLSDFWFDTIVEFNFLYILLIIFCVGYPLFYLIDKPNRKNAESNIDKKRKLDKWFVLYIISFIPYLFLTYSSIFGVDFGFFGDTSTYYGFEALFIALLFGTVVPIYPIILIFQIIYTIKKHKTFTQNTKRYIKCGIVLLILSLLVPSIIHLTIKKNNINNNYEQDKIIIEEYLINNFGKHYNDMEILKPDNLSSSYMIKTPLLDYSFDIYLNENRDAIENDNFYKKFVDQNDMQAKFDQYLTNLFELPHNLKITSIITSIDLKDYSKTDSVDSLLSKCQYKINSIYVFSNSYNQEEIINIIKDYFIKYNSNLKQYYTQEWINFYVKINSEFYASIQVISSEQNNKLTLIFSGYNYGEGYTIPHEKVYIDLSN